MKKIGIITIIDYDNYGNRLQNYAMSVILNKQGLNNMTIRNSPPTPSSSFWNKSKKLLKTWPTKTIKILNNKLKRILYKDIIKRRKNNFVDFTKKYIPETEYYITNDTSKDLLEKINLDYDYFVVGSDQVWNPHFRRGNEADFLTFTDQHKRIAVAASFGISELEEKWIDFYKDRLKYFKSISVREETGKEIVNNLINFKPAVLIDPTLMLSKKEWMNIASTHHSKPRRPYILIYSLGGTNDKVSKLLNSINKDNSFDVVVLSNLKYKMYYDVGPSEFIDYIKDASLFITDSFHGVVFALILETAFVVFDRNTESDLKSMNSRIDRILNLFDITNRSIENLEENEIFEKVNSNYKFILKEEQQKFDEFLNKALDIEIISGGEVGAI